MMAVMESETGLWLHTLHAEYSIIGALCSGGTAIIQHFCHSQWSCNPPIHQILKNGWMEENSIITKCLLYAGKIYTDIRFLQNIF